SADPVLQKTRTCGGAVSPGLREAGREATPGISFLLGPSPLPLPSFPLFLPRIPYTVHFEEGSPPYCLQPLNPLVLGISCAAHRHAWKPARVEW
ncbi:hypothetical protein MC885_006740, partial [Smutsia gigantea]